MRIRCAFNAQLMRIRGSFINGIECSFSDFPLAFQELDSNKHSKIICCLTSSDHVDLLIFLVCYLAIFPNIINCFDLTFVQAQFFETGIYKCSLLQIYGETAHLLLEFRLLETGLLHIIDHPDRSTAELFDKTGEVERLGYQWIADMGFVGLPQLPDGQSFD